MNETEKLKRSARLHRVAMEYEDDAILAHHAGKHEEYYRLSEEAYAKEYEAAELIRNNVSHHMHGTLHRSAATLAFRCGKFRDAERLIVNGLVADPDLEIREKLHRLLIEVRFHSWLGSRVPPTSENDIVMTLTGTEADTGTLEITSFATRITKCESLILNSIGHVRKYPFGKLRELTRDYRVLTAPPSEGSFKINMQLVPIQQSLPGFDIIENVYDSMIDGFKILENGDTSALRARFHDDDYYHDFMWLARDLAPDGVRINAFSLEAQVKGTREIVVFERTREDIDSIYSPPQREVEELDYRITDDEETVVGTLRYANTMKDERELKLVPDGGKPWDIIVTNDLDDDVIRDHFGYLVRVTGRHIVRQRKSRRLYLEKRADIQKVDSKELALFK